MIRQRGEPSDFLIERTMSYLATNFSQYIEVIIRIILLMIINVAGVVVVNKIK